MGIRFASVCAAHTALSEESIGTSAYALHDKIDQRLAQETRTLTIQDLAHLIMLIGLDKRNHLQFEPEVLQHQICTLFPSLHPSRRHEGAPQHHSRKLELTLWLCEASERSCQGLHISQRQIHLHTVPGLNFPVGRGGVL